MIQKIKDILENYKLAKTARKFFNEKYSFMMYDFYNGKLTEEQLLNYFKRSKSVINEVKQYEQEEKNKELAKRKKQLKKAKEVSNESLMELEDNLFVLNHSLKQLEKTDPTTKRGIKAKETKMENLQDEINQTEQNISILKEFLKTKRKKYKIVEADNEQESEGGEAM